MQVFFVCLEGEKKPKHNHKLFKLKNNFSYNVLKLSKILNINRDIECMCQDFQVIAKIFKKIPF